MNLAENFNVQGIAPFDLITRIWIINKKISS